MKYYSAWKTKVGCKKLLNKQTIESVLLKHWLLFFAFFIGSNSFGRVHVIKNIPCTIVSSTPTSIPASTTKAISFTYATATNGIITNYFVGNISREYSTNLINGLPFIIGSSNILLTACNESRVGIPDITQSTFSTPIAPVVTSAATASGTANTSFTYQITASNTPTSYDAIGLPAGLSVNTSTGVISGTPNVVGESIIVINATNAGGTGSQSLTITINDRAVIIAPTTSTCATVGSAFSYIPTIYNSPTSFSISGYSELNGSAPNLAAMGLSLNPTTGAITGTPLTSAAGAYYISLSAGNAAGNSSISFTLSINPSGPVTITGATPCMKGGYYPTLTVSPTCGTCNYAWSIAGGGTFNGNSAVTATGNSAVYYVNGQQATIQASYTNGSCPIVSGSLVISLAPPTPILTTPSCVTSASGAKIIVSNDAAIKAAYPAFTGYTVTYFNILSSGTELNYLTETGPTPPSPPYYPSAADGSFTVPVNATVANATTGGDALYTIAVAGCSNTYVYTPVISISPSSILINGVGNGGTLQSVQSGLTLTASPVACSTCNYIWNVAAGGGSINGGLTTATAGSVTYFPGSSVSPVNVSAQYKTGYNSCAISQVGLLPLHPVISSAATASGTANTSFTYQITASNTPTSYDAIGLPAGLSVNTSTGVISGTPNVVGESIIVINATNAGGTGSQSLTITIDDRAVIIAPTTSTCATVGSAFSYIPTIYNSPTSFSISGYSELNGSAPNLAAMGLSLNPTTGAITGTPLTSAAGAYYISLSAGNAAGNSSISFTLSINPSGPVTITGATPCMKGGYYPTLTVSPTCGTCNYAWSIAGGGTFNGNSAVTATGNSAVYYVNGQQATIQASYTNGSCPIVSGSLVISLAPPTPILTTPSCVTSASGAKIIVSNDAAIKAAYPAFTGYTVTYFNILSSGTELNYLTETGPTPPSPPYYPSAADGSFTVPVNATVANATTGGDALYTIAVAGCSNTYVYTPVISISPSSILINGVGNGGTLQSVQSGLTLTASPVACSTCNYIWNVAAGGGSINGGLTTATAGSVTYFPGSSVSPVNVSAQYKTGYNSCAISQVGLLPLHPVISSAATGAGTANMPFTYQITATNGPTSYNATGLPAGLSVNTTTGVISGVSTVIGAVTVTISATNTGGTGTMTLTLTFDGRPVITNVSPAVICATAGGVVNYQVTTANPATSFSFSGYSNYNGYSFTLASLGLTFNTTTGLLSGTILPGTAGGSYTCSIYATNAAGYWPMNMQLTINPTGVTISGTPQCMRSGNYTTLTASPAACYSCIYTWSVASGGGTFNGATATTATGNSATYTSNGQPATIQVISTNDGGLCPTSPATIVASIAPPSPIITAPSCVTSTSGAKIIIANDAAIKAAYPAFTGYTVTYFNILSSGTELNYLTETGPTPPSPQYYPSAADGSFTIPVNGTVANATTGGDALYSIAVAGCPGSYTYSPVISITPSSVLINGVGNGGTLQSVQSGLTLTATPVACSTCNYIWNVAAGGGSINGGLTTATAGSVTYFPGTSVSPVNVSAQYKTGYNSCAISQVGLLPLHPVISSAATGAGTANMPFTYQITATNGPTSYNATGLPAGLSVNTTTGVISGTSTVIGVVTVTISATNTGGTGTMTLTLTFDGKPYMTAPSTYCAVVGTAANYAPVVYNNPTLISISGYNNTNGGALNLATMGLTFNTTTGVLSGVPLASAAGSYNITIAAANSVLGAIWPISFTLAISPSSNIGGSPQCLVSGNYTTLTANSVACATCTYTWSIASGGGTFNGSTATSATGNSVAYVSNGQTATIQATSTNLGICPLSGTIIASIAPPSPVIIVPSCVTFATGAKITVANDAAIKAACFPSFLGYALIYSPVLPNGLDFLTDEVIYPSAADGTFTVPVNTSVITPMNGPSYPVISPTAGGDAVYTVVVAGSCPTVSRTLMNNVVSLSPSPIIINGTTSLGAVGQNTILLATPIACSTCSYAWSTNAGTFSATTGNPVTYSIISANASQITATYRTAYNTCTSSTVNVIPSVPTILSPLTASGSINRPFSYIITASNYTTSYNATGLPPGLSVNTFTGLISGTPTTYGTFAVTLNAINAQGTGSATLTIINNNITIPAAANSVGTPDDNLNWIKSTTYDASGNVLTQGKNFYDDNGGLIQSQTKVAYRKDINTVYTHILATQPLLDAYNRPVATTLAAPINYADFSYQPNFVQAPDGTSYTYKNFDLYNPSGLSQSDKTNAPDPIGGQATPGTLGWYYSSNNTWEPYTPTTNYPYSRENIYSDGTNAVKKQAGTGEVFVMGSGHETSNNMAPVINELNNYLQIRNQYFAITDVGQEPTSLINQATILTSKDANGNELIEINDQAGKTLMTARPGNDLTVSNSVTLASVSSIVYTQQVTYTGTNMSIQLLEGGNNINAYLISPSNVVTQIYTGQAIHFPLYTNVGSGTLVIQSDVSFFALVVDQTDHNLNSTAFTPPSSKNITYFKIFADNTPVSITGGGYTLYNMNTESAISFGNTLSKGYYKLVATSGVSVTLSYTNSFTDVSYNYYNQLGQLIASIAPEGVKQLYTNTYASKTAIPFVNLYQYNVQGKLVSKTTADGGTTQFVYRQDGKIRFSQNSVQAPVGKFSYVNYDQLGRPIEGGEYLPDANGIVFGSTLMTSVLENVTPTGGLTTGTKYDVEAILYDIPDASYGLTSYVQDPIYVGGAVSAVRKYSSIVNNLPVATNIVSASWYNYDEEGKVVWKIKFIQGLGYKTTDYTYDVLGRLIKKVYQANTAAETFIHYFQFDPANGNLWKIYTNTVDHPVVYIGGSFSRNPNPDPTTDMLQATYIYYLHGGLKRIELATNLQGIDYTYTLQGALKAINNSNKNADPGGDNTSNNGFGPDAFGTVLDYFPGDYANSRTTGVQSIAGVNTSSIIPPANESYVGNIKAMSWYSEKPASVTSVTDAPVAYIYQYDPKYQFTNSTWGTIPDFTASPANFSATNFNQETVQDPVAGTPAYDENGNILNLQRTDGGGNLTDKFAYNYVANTNQLGSVVNTATGTPQTYASYTYDAIGRMTSETITNPITNVITTEYVQYDITNKVRAVTTDPAFNNPLVSYVYDEAGTRIIKNTYNSSNQLIEITYYAGDATYTQSVTGGTYGAIIPEEYQIQGRKNRLGIYYRSSNIYAYQLTDHLGNVRAVIAQSGTTYQVRMYTDYYPYGMVIQQGGSNDYRYGYQGDYSEKDNETNWNAFELRMYDSRIGRWMTMDPAEQYYSPYEAMGNNPVSITDPTGASDDDPCDASSYYPDSDSYDGGDVAELDDVTMYATKPSNNVMATNASGQQGDFIGNTFSNFYLQPYMPPQPSQLISHESSITTGKTINGGIVTFVDGYGGTVTREDNQDALFYSNGYTFNEEVSHEWGINTSENTSIGVSSNIGIVISGNAFGIDIKASLTVMDGLTLDGSKTTPIEGVDNISTIKGYSGSITPVGLLLILESEGIIQISPEASPSSPFRAAMAR